MEQGSWASEIPLISPDLVFIGGHFYDIAEVKNTSIHCLFQDWTFIAPAVATLMYSANLL